MILLRPDCLVFKTSDGDLIPCSAKQVMVELIGDAADWLDKDVIVQASEAVLHYFRSEKGQESVSVGEFVEALERVLKGLGLDVKASASSSDAPANRRIVEADLCELAGVSGSGTELFFFPLLRNEVHRRLDGSPSVLLFRGLRSCVKQIVGAKRWNEACRDMNDQIVDYLRNCLNTEKASHGCALVVM